MSFDQKVSALHFFGLRRSGSSGTGGGTVTKVLVAPWQIICLINILRALS